MCLTQDSSGVIRREDMVLGKVPLVMGWENSWDTEGQGTIGENSFSQESLKSSWRIRTASAGSK